MKAKYEEKFIVINTKRFNELMTSCEDKYDIKFSAKEDSNIDEGLMQELENGLNLYVEYLQSGIATKNNIELIKNLKNKLIIECVGGCIYTSQSSLWQDKNYRCIKQDSSRGI